METRPHPAPVLPPTAPTRGMFDGSSPKLTFIFGLIGGIALTAIVGLAIILPRAYGDSKTSKNSNTTAAAPTNTAADTAPTFSDVKAVGKDDYIRGEKDAKLTLIAYSDLECPFCKTFHPTLSQLLTDYKGDVNVVFRHYPLSFHANAPKEAEATLCVGKLGGAEKYWTFVDKIFEQTTSNGTGFALDKLGPLAKEVGVNQANFQKCLDNGDMTQRVKDETADGNTGGVTGTPSTLIVNPKTGKTLGGIPGAYPLDQAKNFIDAALKLL